MKIQKLVTYTLWANRTVMAAVGVLIFALPAVLRWYAGLLEYDLPKADLVGIWISYMLCAAVIVVALWNMEKLLGNLLCQQVFIRENVQRVRRVQWCCGIVAAICVVCTVFALPALLIAAIMGFLCLVVSVVSNVLDAAVTLQEENDLTI